ncbi:MAG: hypothetical protein WBE29_25520, partial [Pseudolabrys sp.]
IEHRQVAFTALNLEHGAYLPRRASAEAAGLAPINLPLFQGARLGVGVTSLHRLAWFVLLCCRREEHASCKAMSAFTVAIRGKADMASALQNVR